MHPNNMASRPVRPVAVAQDAGVTFDNGPSVVKEKGGKKTGWILAVVLLLIVAIGGVGFGVWMMMDGSAQKDALNSQISALKQQNNDLQDKLDNGGDTIIDIDTDADVWSSFSSGVAKIPMIGGGMYWMNDGTTNVQRSITAYKDAEGHFLIKDYDQSILIELDDILSFYFVHAGNGLNEYFYIIDTDGNVSRFGDPGVSGAKLEKLDGYTKITTVFEDSSDLGIALVDIYGNVYKVY